MPLLWIALAFACGMWIASWTTVPWWGWLVLAAAFPASVFLLNRRGSASSAWLLRRHPELLLPPLLLPVMLLAGALRYDLSRPLPPPGDVSRWIGPGTVTVTGVISSPPEPQGERVRLLVTVEQLQLAADSGPAAPPFAVRGKLAASVAQTPKWRYGDRIRLTGSLQAPPDGEDYSYREALSHSGVFAEMPFARAALLDIGRGNPLLAAIYAFRGKALTTVYALFPPPESALLAGILLGDDSRLPQPLSQAFKDTGTAHIIAISGFNIAILAGLLAVLFSRLAGPRWGAALTAVGIGLYTVLVGAGASVVRAAIMGSLGLLASQVGRRQIGLNTLGATALAMFLIRPLWAWDAGFQLSFFATLGLILYARPLQEGFVRLAGRILPNGISERAADAVGEYLLFTLAAEIFTLPIQVTQFGRLSLAAVAANPLVLPAQPAVMILGGLATLLGLAAPPLGKAAAMLAWPFLAYTIRVVEWLAGFPLAAVSTGPISPWIAAFWIALAIVPAVGVDRLRPAAARIRGWVRPALLAAGLAAAVLLIWRTALVHLDHRLRLSLVGGQAQAALLIQAPSGQTVLVDGGSSADQLSRAIGQRLAPFDRRTAALVITAAGRDSTASLPEVIDQYPPDLVLWAADPGGSASALAVQGRLSQRKIPASQAHPGDRLDLGDGIWLTILGDPGADPTGVLVSWRSFRALLPLVKPARLPAQAGPVSLLILPDRLLKETPTVSWQSRFQPVEILVNGSSADRPPENLRSTARNGWIQASTDGDHLWLEVERE